MPIQTRTEKLATGIRSTLGIKVFGPDLKEIEETAVTIEEALQQDPRTQPYTHNSLVVLSFALSSPSGGEAAAVVIMVQSLVEP